MCEGMEKNLFSYELKLAINGLNNKKRQTIISILGKHDKLSFSEIVKLTEIEKSLLTHHLKTLQKSLLITHFYEHTIGNDNFSFYELSAFGRILINALFNVMNPIPPSVKRVLEKRYQQSNSTQHSDLTRGLTKRSELSSTDTIELSLPL